MEIHSGSEGILVTLGMSMRLVFRTSLPHLPQAASFSASPVIPQVVLPPEGLVADVTRVRPLVRVGPLVDEQVVGFGKVSAAELADKLFFRFRGQPPSGGLSVRSQFTEA